MEKKYLSREECIELLVKECKFYKEENLYKISKISSQMVTHPSRKFLWDSIIKLTPNYIKENIAERIYWLIYFISSPPICKYCNKNITKFNGFNLGYSQYCSQSCVGKASNTQRQKTVKQRYPNFYDTNRGQAKNTHIRKYGKFFNNREQAKKTCIEKYGVENVAHIEQVKQAKQTTCLQKYGAITPFHSMEIQKSIKDNTLKKYGVENISQLDQVKYKKQNKFNNKSKEEIEAIYEKKRQTFINKTEEEIKSQFDKSKITYFNKTGYYHQSHNPNSGIFNKSVKSKYHPDFNNIIYQSNNEKQFLDLINDLNLNKYIKRGCSIKYKHIKVHFYIIDYILEYTPDDRYLIEIKATHQYFHKDLWSGKLFAKWEATENYCKNNNYKDYIFILNNKIITKQEIINEFMIPFFNMNYPYL